MNVLLRKMTEEEFASFVQYSVEDHTNELIRQDDLQPEEALRQSQSELRDMLPDGLSTENHDLLTIINAESGENAGFVWSIYEENEGRKQSFLCDFLVFERCRRKGYATAALSALENRAVQKGCAECVLFVSDENHAAKALYRKCGYQPLRRLVSGEYLIKKL